MNATRTLIVTALVATFGAGSAFAQDDHSMKTREQVRAEVLAARASGELAALNSIAADGWTATHEAAPKARADVLAELQAARADGTLAALNSEFTPDTVMASAPARSRADVRAELVAARTSGEFAELNRPF